MEKKVEKIVLITLQDGAMYRFGFYLLYRKSKEEMAFGNRPCYRIKNDIVSVNTPDNSGFLKYEEVFPDEKIEIKMVSGFQKFLRHDTDFNLVFLDKYKYSDGIFDYYINYPRVLTDINQSLVVVKNWSINFLDYILNFSTYDPDLSFKYSKFWGIQISMRRAIARTQIEKIEFI